MTKTRKKILIVLALFLTVAAIITAAFIRRGHSYDVELFRNNSGWGYNVLKDGRTFIHQPYIPAIEGEIPFRSKEEAGKTARIVVRKLRKKQIPAVSREEMEKLFGQQPPPLN
ncbi:MAG: DUF4907 domain-containing protein [Bacteroidales bacterium]|jgi:hypothetical protein|nr:DUF4907 domain-containing protein [Bacteroidales bacterium]